MTTTVPMFVGSLVSYTLTSNNNLYMVTSGVLFSNDHSAMSLPNMELLLEWSIYLTV